MANIVNDTKLLLPNYRNLRITKTCKGSYRFAVKDDNNVGWFNRAIISHSAVTICCCITRNAKNNAKDEREVGILQVY